MRLPPQAFSLVAVASCAAVTSAIVEIGAAILKIADTASSLKDSWIVKLNQDSIDAEINSAATADRDLIGIARVDSKSVDKSFQHHRAGCLREGAIADAVEIEAGLSMHGGGIGGGGDGGELEVDLEELSG